MTSNLDKSAGEMFICSGIGEYSSNLPYFGFAAPSKAHLDCRVAVIPAFAILMLCCSIASCIEERSCDVILSNSSMQAIPLSANTKAPASSVQRPSPNSSRTAAAVNPAALVDFPEV